MSSGGVQTLVSKGFAALRLNQARARKSFSRSTTYVVTYVAEREKPFSGTPGGSWKRLAAKSCSGQGRGEGIASPR